MKKILMAMAVAFMCVAAARAEFVWSWWTNAPSENATKDVDGCAMGIASKTASIQGAQVSLIYNVTGKVRAGAQVSLFYNNADVVNNGPQVGFVNVADGAALQFGLLCFNKEGFLPFFPFFNFAKGHFGAIK